MKIFILLFLTMALLYSCRDAGNVFCTEEFRTITIEIKGETLDDFYTIRASTNDTINYSIDSDWYGSFYPLLDDLYKDKIKNKTEIFIFEGIIADSVVIREEYEIYSDECHVYYVSGELELQL